MFLDGILISNKEEAKEKLLEYMTENVTFTCNSDNPNNLEILRDCTTKSEELAEEMELMSSQSSEAKEK